MPVGKQASLLEEDKPTLVLDCSAVCYAAYYKLGNLSYGQQATGVIYGFFETIRMLADKYNTNDFVFCWDSDKSIRRDRYPWYKDRKTAENKKTEAERKALFRARNQFKVLQKKIIPALGFVNSFQQEGYESDDLIARTVKGNEARFIIVSNDEDLYQLFDYADIHNIRSKMKLTKHWFRREYGIEPSQWVDVKSIGGCQSDTVPGIPYTSDNGSLKHVGPTAALAFVRKTMANNKKKALILSMEGRKAIERNRWLVELPILGTMSVSLAYPDDYDVSLTQFIAICEEYGMHSFLKRENLDWWKSTFNMKGKK